MSYQNLTQFRKSTGLDGQRVIIFGGDETNRTVAPQNSLYVLDINNFNWYIPKTTGKIQSARNLHGTVLIGKYMVVTFGKYNNYILYFIYNYLSLMICLFIIY